MDGALRKATNRSNQFRVWSGDEQENSSVFRMADAPDLLGQCVWARRLNVGEPAEVREGAIGGRSFWHRFVELDHAGDWQQLFNEERCVADHGVHLGLREPQVSLPL